MIFQGANAVQSVQSGKLVKCLVKCDVRRLILGLIKAGKTYEEIMRMFNMEYCFSILVTINQIASRNQTKEQALEIGFKEEDIILPQGLRKQNNKYGSLAGKLLIVNLNENYDAKVSDIIGEGHRQNLIVNYTSDEYDLNAVVLDLTRDMTRHQIEERWITALNEKDIFTCVSATNAVGYYSRNITWTEVKRTKPWHSSYKGMTDIAIKNIDDITAEELNEGIVGSSLLGRIKKENNTKKKALIKVTNLVSWDKDNPKTHAELLNQFLAADINAVVMNSTSYPTAEEYDAAVVIITGAMANRTKEFKDIYSQYLDFGENLWDAAIIQALRLCGARPYTPILYVPASRRKKLDAAITNEINLINADWSEEEHKQSICKDSKPLPDKVKGQVKQKQEEIPLMVLSLKEYSGPLTLLYPMIDDINYHESKGTRIYGDKEVTYLVKKVVNTFSKDRIQPDRNLVIPDKDGNIPQGIATSIRMGEFYKSGMKTFSSYYIDQFTYEIKVALWDISLDKEEKYDFHVEETIDEQTESWPAAK